MERYITYGLWLRVWLCQITQAQYGYGLHHNDIITHHVQEEVEKMDSQYPDLLILDKKESVSGCYREN